MLSVAAAFVLAVTARAPEPAATARVVTAVPFGSDVPTRALSSALEGALAVAARERGLTSRPTSTVKPVDEAVRSCADDPCRLLALRRLGASYAVLAQAHVDGVVLTVVELDAAVAPAPTTAPIGSGGATGAGVERARVRIDGAPPAVAAALPRAVDALLESVAPAAAFRAGRALARLRAARVDGRLSDALDACVELAALEPDKRAKWLLEAAEIAAEAGDAPDATRRFAELAADPTAPESIRVEALARSRTVSADGAAVEGIDDERLDGESDAAVH